MTGRRAPSPQRRLAPSSAEAGRILAAAHRETIDGRITLHLAGTAYEMGFQHGALCRHEIHAFRREAYAYMAKLIAAGLHWPPALARLATRPLLLRQVRRYWPHTPPEYRDEMHGVAAGARVHVLEALLVNAVWEMYLEGGCSEFAVSGERSADGDLLHGYNYDLADPEHAFINPYLALIFSRPVDGHPFVQLNTVGCVGVNAGMSAAGISVAWDNTHLRPGSTLLDGAPKSCTPFELALRRLIQYAISAEDGVAIMRSHLPRPTADIIIIGDGAANRALAMEMAGGSAALRRMHAGAVWSANSFVSPELSGDDRRGPPSADLDETGSRLGRFASYTELIELSGQKVDVARAVEILRDPYPRERGGYIYPDCRTRTICRPVTSFSLVMQPRSGRLWVGDGRIPAPLGSYRGFDLRTETPLKEDPLPPTGFHAAVEACDHWQAGRSEAALAAVERAQALDGPSAPLERIAALVLSNMGRDGEANERLELARRLETGVPGESFELYAPGAQPAILSSSATGGPAALAAPGTPGGTHTSSGSSIPFPSAILPRLRLSRDM